MENPFPSIDPWMEGQWGDAHASLIIYIRDRLLTRLPPDLKARAEERVYMEILPSRRAPLDRGRTPDVRVERRTRGARRETAGSVATIEEVATADPVVVRLPPAMVTETFIEIRERRPLNRLVTIIEVLSPANKHAGQGRREYRQKQQQCLQAGVNLVEIDLLRGGRWTVLTPQLHLTEAQAHVAYRISMWRATTPDVTEFIPIALREPLPAIAIPLRPTDRDVPLELQPLINKVYVSGEYDDTNYDAPAKPPLKADDAAWVDGILRAKSVRKAP